MIDPLIRQAATDSADAAQFAAAVAAGDVWEWQAIIDSVTDVDRGRRLLAAMATLYVSFATEACAQHGINAVQFLHDCAIEQIATADEMQNPDAPDAP